MKQLLNDLTQLYRRLYADKKREHRRSLSFGDYFTDRWERARLEGFGGGSSVYDNVLIMGDVVAGKNVWVGPNCILDGRGGLVIGDNCDISAGAHIYTHHTVRRATSLGQEDIELAPVTIGNGVYIGPNSVIEMGVSIGDQAVIGALSLVNRDIPAGARAHGSPVKVIEEDG